MARRRVAESLSTPGAVPAVFMEYAETGGFWDTPDRVKAWCMKEGIECPPASYFAYPPGLRQWCVDAWGKREGHVNRWGIVDHSKLRDLGIWRGYGRDYGRARRPHVLSHEDLNAWRPISAPHNG